MKAFDYNAVVTDEGLILCTSHFPHTVTSNGTTRIVTLDDTSIMPIFASDEWDSYPVCDVCGKEHDYVGLTTAQEDTTDMNSPIGKE